MRDSGGATRATACLFVHQTAPRISHNTFGWLVYSCQVAYCVNRRIKISEETALPALTLPPPRLYLSSCPPSDFSPSDPHLLLRDKRKQTGTLLMTKLAAVGGAWRKCPQKSVATLCDRRRIRVKKREENKCKKVLCDCCLDSTQQESGPI